VKKTGEDKKHEGNPFSVEKPEGIATLILLESKGDSRVTQTSKKARKKNKMHGIGLKQVYQLNAPFLL